VRHVTDLIRRYQPDLVHTSLFEADLAGRLAAWRTRTPVMVSLVNTSYVPDAWPDGRSARGTSLINSWTATWPRTRNISKDSGNDASAPGHRAYRRVVRPLGPGSRAMRRDTVHA
jgi:hypothetical protein